MRGFLRVVRLFFEINRKNIVSHKNIRYNESAFKHQTTLARGGYILQRPLVERTADAIIKYITIEDMTAGDKLPNEYELAKQLDVGRSTIREAVRSLASRNILEVRQGSGTYVSHNTGISEDPLGFAFVDDTLKLTEDLFALRYILEPEVAMLAAYNRTEEEIDYLEQVAREIEEAMESPEQHLLHFKLDIEFHSVISKMSGNIAMNHLIPVINQSITLYNSYYTNEQSKSETIISHREICEGIRNENPFQAKYAMQSHIANNQRQLEANRNNNLSATN